MVRYSRRDECFRHIRDSSYWHIGWVVHTLPSKPSKLVSFFKVTTDLQKSADFVIVIILLL